MFIPGNTRLAHLAGFVDGDGCVSVARYTAKSRLAANPTYQPMHHLRISASQLEEHRWPLDELKRQFGGSVRPTGKRCGRKMLQWETTGRRAAVAVRALYPYFEVKHKAAFIGLLFQAHKETSQQSRRIGERASSEEVTIGKLMSRVCSYLNGRGRPNQLGTGAPHGEGAGR